ncbi:MAG TPA: hypothetical protein VM327_06595 [Candidatus Thermoplasmatota archaeon]|nr:hypothetical protein [Candidatus Thermoplasmatota archaeon]
MKILAVAVLFVLATLVAPSSGQTATISSATRPMSPGFGVSGLPSFSPYPLPEDLPTNLASGPHSAGEPTIGIPWNTDHLFFQAFSDTYKAVFDDRVREDGKAQVTWTRVSPAFTPINVDPILIADPVSGRIFAGGLAGPCSLLGISDDDGETWTPAGNACSGAQFDHESIGSGHWSTTSPDSAGRAAVYPRATYYCAQLSATSCATSNDGGKTWLPFTEIVGGCGGLHGHIEVSEVTGMAAVPDAGCSAAEGAVAPGSGRVGFGYTTTNGAVWLSRKMPESETGRGFDPAVMFSRESGWLWLGQADNNGIHIALSKDEGQTWETLGNDQPGASEASAWYALNLTYTDPVTGEHLRYGAFSDIEAGDDDRVAFTYLATTNQTAEHPFDSCEEDSDPNVWHYYLSQSFDAGQSWTTTRLWEDPVQVGAIWNGGGGDACRNLLDFADMHIDSAGRIHVGFADGCTKECSDAYFAWRNGTGEAPKGEDSRDAWGTVLRQETGRGLFAKYDVADEIVQPPTQSATDQPDSEAAPGLPALGLLTVVVTVALVLRRRHI